MSGAIIALLRGGAKAPVTTFTWQWQFSLDGVSGWTNILGATSQTYTPLVIDAGRYLRVAQTATDDGGSTTAFSAAVGPLPLVFANLALNATDFLVFKVTALDQRTRLPLITSTTTTPAAVTAANSAALTAGVTVSDKRV